jgi:hypothetical protein
VGWTDEMSAEVKRLRADGYSWTHIGATIKETYSNELHSMTESQVIRKARIIINGAERGSRQSKTYHPDGSIESVCLIELWDKDNITPDEILAFHHLDPHKWEIVNCTNNLWHSQNKTSRLQMYQSKVTAKPKSSGLTFSDIDAYFKDKVFPKPSIIPTQYSHDGEVLEICLPDLHAGLLAWGKETGADYDIHIARDAFIKCITDIRERCNNRSFKRIYFVTLGDILHTDNDNQTTSKGTFQQVDGRIAKIFDYALDMLIDALDLLGELAPVEIVFLSGNHDRLTGYTLFKALQMGYRQDTNYSFDVDPDPQKFRLIGCNLVGWTHGDMSRKNMGAWLQDRARVEYGQSKFAEVHAGHLHRESRTETYRTYTDETGYTDGGIVVRHLPIISNSSSWEHQSGYPFGNKSLMCFVWNEKNGLRETWYSNL